jgi:hypothetical protein
MEAPKAILPTPNRCPICGKIVSGRCPHNTVERDGLKFAQIANGHGMRVI